MVGFGLGREPRACQQAGWHAHWKSFYYLAAYYYSIPTSTTPREACYLLPGRRWQPLCFSLLPVVTVPVPR